MKRSLRSLAWILVMISKIGCDKPCIFYQTGMRLLGRLSPLALLASCAPSSNVLPQEHWVTTYYDRNHDGIVDFELHTLGRGRADADWALSDTKFRGRYDVRIHWGYVLEKKRVDLPAPKNVSINPGQPDVSTTK
jgi:hypothetical protein